MDSWGTKNTATGEYWVGKPYNYVNSKGENAKYREQIPSIDNRELYERAFGKTKWERQGRDGPALY